MGLLDTSTSVNVPGPSVGGGIPATQRPTIFGAAPTAPVDPFAPGSALPPAGGQNIAAPVSPLSAPQPQAPTAPVITAPATSITPATVSSQVNQVIDPNSPLMRRAAAVANEQSNDRGLLNSSMAIGAAQNAVLAEAVPIAQADVNAINTMRQTEAQINQQTSMANMAAQNSEIMANLDQANKVQLAGVNAKYQSFLNTNQNASSLYTTTLNSISQIQNNPNMDANTKSLAIQQLITAMHGGMNMLSNISGLNINFSFQ